MERITHGVFTVSFIRNGDVITVYTDVVKSNGDGTSLVQFWNPETARWQRQQTGAPYRFSPSYAYIFIRLTIILH